MGFDAMSAVKAGVREFVGLFSLGFMITGLFYNGWDTMQGTSATVAGDAYMAAFTIGASYYLLFTVFGGYLNPATNLAAAIAGDTDFVSFGINFLFQFLGAFVGFVLAVNFYPNDMDTGSAGMGYSYNKTNYSGTASQNFGNDVAPATGGQPSPYGGDFVTTPFNIAAGFWPRRYRAGGSKDEEATGTSNNTFNGSTPLDGNNAPRADGMAIGSALFFEFFFAMVIVLCVLRKAGNAANGVAYGMTFFMTRNVTGGWSNPAIAIGAAASFSARGYSVRGAVEDEKFDDMLKNENTEKSAPRGNWNVATTGSSSEGGKRWPSGNGYLWIPFLVPFVGALAGNFAAFGMGIAEIGFLKKGGAEEPAV